MSANNSICHMVVRCIAQKHGRLSEVHLLDTIASVAQLCQMDL